MKHLFLAFACALAIAALTACSGAGMSTAGASASTGSGTSANSSASTASASSAASSSASQGTGALPESAWGNLFATLGDDYLAFGRRMQTELPVKAYACYQGEGGGDPIWFDDPSTIVKLFNALATTNVTEDVGEIWTDDYTSFGFEFADGTKTGFMFDSMTIQVAAGNSWKFYALEVGPDLQSFADMAKKATLGE